MDKFYTFSEHAVAINDHISNFRHITPATHRFALATKLD